MKLAALGLVALTLAVAQPQKSVDPAFAADVRKLMDLMGTRGLMEAQIDQGLKSMADSIRSQPGMSPEFFDEFRIRFKKRLNIEVLLSATAEIYARHLTHDEIRQLIVFYETPLGRKMIAVLPGLQSEVFETFFKLGSQMGAEVGAEIEKEHPEYVRKKEEPVRQKL